MNGGNPGLLLSSIPTALGREPAEEILLVAPLPHAAAVVVSIPLPTNPDAATGMLHPACVTAVEYLRSTGVRAVIIVVYAASAADLDGVAGHAAALINVLADQRGVVVLDTLRVIDHRWWSYECENPQCCPSEGSAIPTPEENPA
jgi:hypothetical protein